MNRAGGAVSKMTRCKWQRRVRTHLSGRWKREEGHLSPDRDGRDTGASIRKDAGGREVAWRGNKAFSVTVQAPDHALERRRTAGRCLVDAPLQDCGDDHLNSAEEESEADPLDGAEVDLASSKSGVDDEVHQRYHEDDGDRWEEEERRDSGPKNEW